MGFDYEVKVVWGKTCMSIQGCENIEEVAKCVLAEMERFAPTDAQIQAYRGASIVEYLEFNGETWEVK